MIRDCRRGDVFWVELDPVRAAEMTKTRPCIVLSANEVNQRRRTVVIVPLISTVEPARFPLLIEAPSAGKDSKVRTEQIRVVDKTRLMDFMGRVNDSDLRNISQGVAKVLYLA